jgi:hypothetical protein
MIFGRNVGYTQNNVIRYRSFYTTLTEFLYIVLTVTIIMVIDG